MHALNDHEILRRLGRGEAIESICSDARLTRSEFDSWWQKCARDRVSSFNGAWTVPVSSSVEILRDEWGIPHIFAESDTDLFLGFGVAMAQDRLFQLDYLRRKGAGRLAEILGPDALELDIIARTVGLNRIARDEWRRIPAETKELLSAFSNGINAFIDQLDDRLPIEFDLLDYRPEPWSPSDCLLVENEFRWYLTGRLPVIVIPELAKRELGQGPLFQEFLRGEADDECILPPGSYAAGASPGSMVDAVGQAMGMPGDGIGSNNWAIAGSHTRNGLSLVASDPHIAFEAVSCWYEVHLSGGSFNVAGMAYVGMPAVIVGRNERTAWGITNNICSQRDLYQERTSEEHPGCFLYDREWVPARELSETIVVRNSAPVERKIRFSRNGPLVDEILPVAALATGPVSLKWLGAYEGGWLTAMLAMNRAEGIEEFNRSLESWHVPTFCLVFADEDGRIGFKTTGRIPLRRRVERGYRRGWDPEDQWMGLIPFDEMPGILDPERGWLATANNRIAASDFPFPLSGTWSRGHRAIRIREMIEERLTDHGTGRCGLSFEDCRTMHQDVVSVRVAERIPALLQSLGEPVDEQAFAATEILRSWNHRCEPDDVGPTLFNVFFTHWTEAVVLERFDTEKAPLLIQGGEAIAARLLTEDPHGWFAPGRREVRIREVFAKTLVFLSDRLGPEPRDWTWGRIHQMPLRHVLSRCGELSQLLDQGRVPVKGDMGTVCNSGSGPDWLATTGSGYRMIAELEKRPRGLWAIDGQSQSGQPHSPHYDDQLDDWIAGNYHFIPLARTEVGKSARYTLTLNPPA